MCSPLQVQGRAAIRDRTPAVALQKLVDQLALLFHQFQLLIQHGQLQLLVHGGLFGLHHTLHGIDRYRVHVQSPDQELPFSLLLKFRLPGGAGKQLGGKVPAGGLPGVRVVPIGPILPPVPARGRPGGPGQSPSPGTCQGVGNQAGIGYHEHARYPVPNLSCALCPREGVCSMFRAGRFLWRGFGGCLRVWALGLVVAWPGWYASAAEFLLDWNDSLDRVWVGPDAWANRLQDWRVHGGRLECVLGTPRPVRTVQLLSAYLVPEPGTLQMSVLLGPIEPQRPGNPRSWAGFLVGAGGPHVDYRLTALVQHRQAEDGGMLCVVDGTSRLALYDFSRPGPRRDQLAPLPGSAPHKATSQAQIPGGKLPAEVELRLRLSPQPDGRYQVELSAHESKSGKRLAHLVRQGVPKHFADGGLGLVSHATPRGGRHGYWFRRWQLRGSKLRVDHSRRNGPVLGVQYTLSAGVLKLTVQLPPLGPQDTKQAALEVRRSDGSWQQVATAPVRPMSYTATFRVAGWDARRDRPYRVVYLLRSKSGRDQAHFFPGTIRREPWGKRQFVIAAFTGHKIFTGGLKWNHQGVWFPHRELIAAVKHHDPDFLFFSGDQVYEGDLTGAQYQPLQAAMLDYLDKWYRWCWAFRELTRDRPAVTIPDDHDVYHGNIWGAGGKRTIPGFGQVAQDSGGYKMPPEFVNAVQATQTSHLPDPPDPTPVLQGIGVYYCRVEYAGVSFAVLEDRKWKSPPAVLLPEGKVRNGWFQNRQFDPVLQSDVPSALLLGPRQLKFLRHWASDWRHGAWIKVALSQTIFANVATLPAEATSDAVVPRLRTVPVGQYPENDVPVADCDSNGWPASGRRRALVELRRSLAFHIAGDQHLGSTIQYGVDAWDDGPWALCVPSVANTFPRRWFPRTPGRNRKPGAPRYTGRFFDGFGNPVTVHAVSNPMQYGHQPTNLYDRAPGYGIVRLDRLTRQITIECWPRWVDPSRPGAKQYPGWPIRIHQLDNDSRPAAGWLPRVVWRGRGEPVLQVVNETTGEVEYTLRVPGREFQPKVFDLKASYRVRVGDPDREFWVAFPGLRPEREKPAERLIAP